MGRLPIVAAWTRRRSVSLELFLVKAMLEVVSLLDPGRLCLFK